MGEAHPGELAKGVGRGFGGAMLFALPIFMTMEMWRLSVSIDRWRLVLLFLATVVLAFGLEYLIGTMSGREEGVVASLVDTGIALLIGLLAAGVVLVLLAVIDPIESWRQALSIVVIEALPATIGASFARSQLGGGRGATGDGGYLQQVFLMSAGAVVLAANVAPTQEIVLLASKMTAAHALALVVLELALMHGFVYGVDFRGGSRSRDGFARVFVVFTVVGFVVALLVSAYVLWTFGRFESTGTLQSLMQVLVLALPASVGAAAARLVL